MKYLPTIGLEIHSELNTETKMFCDCLNDDQEIEPNKNICPICTGHPGALPKPNKKAVELVIKTGLAMNCEINRFSKFDRKNYFYPDLPKAFQISQYDLPLCKKGKMTLPSGKVAEITRIHLEEDTAKLLHSGNKEKQYSLVDFNRAGVPLMELVTEPCFHSAEDVVEFAKEFRLLLRYLNVSDANMEKGHMRLEANISVAKNDNEGELGTKVEVKNLNSFNSIYLAIKYEIDRQTKLLEKGEKIKQETRGWDEDKQKTVSQRSKESAHDYRYFPEPDLPPMRFSDEFIEKIKSELPELPSERRARLSSEYNLSENNAEILVEEIDLFDFFEKSVSELGALVKNPDVNLIFNYLISDIKGLIGELGISLEKSKLTPHMLAHMVYLIQKGRVSSRAAKDALREAFLNGKDPEKYIEENDLFQVSDLGEIENVVNEVIKENEKVWNDYVSGKEEAIQFLVGMVMRKTKGKADPIMARKTFENKKN